MEQYNYHLTRALKRVFQNKKNIHVYVVKYTNIIQDCLDIKLNVN